MGVIEEVDTDKVGIGWGEFLRVRIKLDLTKPLPRGCMLKLQGQSVWVAFRYERLPKFCFHCGVNRHGSTGCLKRSGIQMHGATPQFGP